MIRGKLEILSNEDFNRITEYPMTDQLAARIIFVLSMKCMQQKIYFSIFCGAKVDLEKSLCGLFFVVTHRFPPHQTSGRRRKKKIVWKSQKNWETFSSLPKKIDLPLKVMNLVFPSSPSLSLSLVLSFPNICYYNNSLKSHEKLRQATGGFREEVFAHLLGGEDVGRERQTLNSDRHVL